MKLRISASTLISALALAVPAVADTPVGNWPSFRGEGARGVADGQGLPRTWNVASGENVRWKTAIPGTGHSSPVVWGDRIFVTTAVSEGESKLVLGDEGGIDLADDPGPFSWRLYCLSATDGSVLWFREVRSGRPPAKRHVKSSQANPTPATDGETVVAAFASGDLVAFGLDGEPRWKADLGVLDPGLFGDPTSHWGYASSPVIWRDRVFAQVDRHANSFVAAYDLETGKRLWKVNRDEKPVWATPTLHTTPEREELIVVGGDFDRGYDPATGKEIWRFARDYEVKTPTPFTAGGLIVLAGGYRGNPVYALRPGGEGDLTPPEGAAAGGRLAWTSEPGGPYTSTPVAYGEHLYFVRDTGILTVLDLATGERVYRQRLASTFSASPVASDGKIYLTGEDGVMRVIAAGPEYRLLGESDMGEPAMATPAIAGGTLYVRTRSHLLALAEGAGATSKPPEPAKSADSTKGP